MKNKQLQKTYKKSGNKIFEFIFFHPSGNGIFGVLRAFSFNYYQFAAFEFLDALFGSATYAAAYIIGK